MGYYNFPDFKWIFVFFFVGLIATLLFCALVIVFLFQHVRIV
jgi:hypothetical protein